MVSSSSGDPATVVFAQALQLATQLNDQTLAHINQLGNMGTILVSDAGKLETVGSNLLSSSIGGPWAWDSTTAKDAVNSLNATTRQTTYSALLPPSWPVFNLKPDLVHQFSSANVSKFGCGFNQGTCEFCEKGVTLTFWNQADRAVADNEFLATIQLLPGVETSTTEVWTFGIVNGNFNTSGQYASVPSSSLTGTLFSILAVGAAAYPPAWWRSTYNPPSYVVCDNVCGSSDSYQGHTSAIGPPAAAYGQQ